MQAAMRLPRRSAPLVAHSRRVGQPVLGIPAPHGVQGRRAWPTTRDPRWARCAATPDTEQTSTSTQESSRGSDSPDTAGEGAKAPQRSDTPAGSGAPHAAEPSSSDQPKPRMQRTLADLDALLGIEEEPEAKDAATPVGGSPASAVDASSSSSRSTDSSKDVAGGNVPRGEAAKGDIDEQFQKIIDRARDLAKEQSGQAGSEMEQAALKREFETLLDAMTKPPDVMDKEELKKLKEACFGPLTFWVTETRPIQEAERSGMLIRGNLRAEREEVFNKVVSQVRELFDGKYQVFMVDDIESEQEMGSRETVGRAQNVREGPRVAFQIIPTAQSEPPQTDGLQRAAAAVLGALIVVSCLQLALATNITRLPAETLQWFANPANLNSDQLPPGLENWDPTEYFESSLPILAAVLGVNLSHEVGHRVTAAVRDVKLGPSFFIPFSEVGTFGAITPFTSLLRNRTQMWDVAMAGPLTGAAVAMGLLLVGLAQTVGTDPSDAAAAASLVSVPTPLFQGSLLLGGITRAVMGEVALRGATVPVSPLLVAGWVGLLTSSLNLLPVGCLDGGRAVQAAFGRQAHALTSFFTYLGLGLGLLGSDLALPFGLYVIICQRNPEKYIQDSVSQPSSWRVACTTAAVLFAVLVLCPMAPELADSLGVGPSTPFK